MDIDWANIRKAVSRIENELARAEKVIKATDVRDEWPEVSRDELQAAFPNWRQEFGNDWNRGFLQKRIGKANYRARPGSSRYRIAPDVLRSLNLPGHRPEPSAGSPEE